MVNTGVPSKGCQRCRQRRVKCDEGKPTCLRCEKLGLPCPGYRKLQDVYFRDESAMTVKRVNEIQIANKLGISSQYSKKDPIFIQFDHGGWLPEEFLASNTAAAYPVLRVPAADIDNLAIAFFLSKFAYYETWYSASYEKWIMDSVHRNGDIYSGLRAAVQAVGMAGICSSSPSPETAMKADMLYGKALKSVNAALKDYRLVTRDETLLVVTVLGLFETVASKEVSRPYSWKSHIDGAAALLKLRGPPKTERELQLYFQIRPQILSLCVQYGIAAPESVQQIGYGDDMQTSSDMPSPQDMRRALACLELSIQLFNLKSEFIAAKTPEALQAAFEGALKLEARLQAWPGTLSPEWQPRIVPTTDPVIRERYLFASSWIRRTWGYWRQYRILINQAIFRYTKSPRQKQLALSKIRQFSREICASTDDIIDGKVVPVLSVYRPCYVVATESHNPDEIRRYASRKLCAIGESVGFRKAKAYSEWVVSDLAESGSVPMVIMLASKPHLSF